MNEDHSVFKPRPRIQSLSDLIFGLALSIGALNLIGQQPATFQALLASLGFYSFSFLILIKVWQAYSSIMSVLPVETEALTSLNVLLLFTVSIEPYLFNQLFASYGEIWHNVSILYAVDLAAMFLVLAFFNHSLADEEKNLVPENYLRKYRFDRNYELFIAAVFIVSIAPFFQSVTVLQIMVGKIPYDIPLRVFAWIAALLLGWSRRLWGHAAKS
jgi:uncharacterized membrane protein